MSVKLVFWTDALLPYLNKTRSFLIWLNIAKKFWLEDNFFNENMFWTKKTWKILLLLLISVGLPLVIILWWSCLTAPTCIKGESALAIILFVVGRMLCCIIWLRHYPDNFLSTFASQTRAFFNDICVLKAKYESVSDSVKTVAKSIFLHRATKCECSDHGKFSRSSVHLSYTFRPASSHFIQIGTFSPMASHILDSIYQSRHQSFSVNS